MLTHKNKLQIYFGDATDDISKQLHCVPTVAQLVNVEPFKSVARKIGVSRLSALNQTHGTQGSVITNSDISFSIDGDYLIANQSHVALGVLTADCVPLILYDAKNKAIGIAHAGWRGAVCAIAPKVFEHMRSLWKCDAHYRIICGSKCKSMLLSSATRICAVCAICTSGESDVAKK